MNEPLFSLGQIVATPGALDAMGHVREIARALLARHAYGDWGDVCDSDAALNDAAVREETRIFSVYHLVGGKKIYVITEWDRSATTLMLPEEY